MKKRWQIWRWRGAKGGKANGIGKKAGEKKRKRNHGERKKMA